MMKRLATQQQQVVEENMSNLTSASGEASATSNQQSSIASQNPKPAAKKKRGLPGNPDPDAEVIALSPKTLMATNRFVCEICNKGFQRDQNLQLHRRGHNLPWKLKQRTSKEVRKKVYICPEVSCVHHDHSRALGDFTGIKKHFYRKHGEKKWKCEKCSKKYAVQSDWKAHSKICGTREYRCDCGTLFSRRDSFITHRAFCDALAEESAIRAITANPVAQPLYSLPLSSHEELPAAALQSSTTTTTTTQAQFSADLMKSQDAISIGKTNRISDPSELIFTTQGDHHSLQHQYFNNMKQESQIDLLSSIYPTGLHSSSLPAAASCFQTSTASPYLSATALLQKAAQMGAIMGGGGGGGGPPRHEKMVAHHHTASAGTGPWFSSSHHQGVGCSSNTFLQDQMACTLPNSVAAGSGTFGTEMPEDSINRDQQEGRGGGGSNSSGRLTRDFLGTRQGFSQIENISMLDMARLDRCMSSSSFENSDPHEPCKE